MSITSRFTYLPDGFTFEVVEYDDGAREYNLIPRSQPSSESSPEPLLAAPLPEAVPSTMEASPTRKQRSLWGFIRASWFIIFTAAGEAIQYLLDNLIGIGLPPRTGAVVGAALYGAKRAIWPNTTI